MRAERIAGAPISWGVCEVPGWGHQLPAERVLRDMRDVGLAATELGPAGFLPGDPRERAELLASYGLRAAGGFLPVVLHQPWADPLPAVVPVLDGLVAAGGGVLVLAAATGHTGYDTRPDLDGASWRVLLRNLDRLATHAAGAGVTTALHPHVGTAVERPDDVRRVLDGCDVALCLDTGHLLAGGVDPVALAREVPGRVAHVHLKDVDGDLARQVLAGGLGFAEAVRRGIFRPLGHGDLDIAGLVAALEQAGYGGWYVLEQDIVLTAEPDGEGPAADVRASVAFLRGLASGASP
ncbi:MAG: TIM barrel protein [Streptomycetales bacterium]